MASTDDLERSETLIRPGLCKSKRARVWMEDILRPRLGLTVEENPRDLGGGVSVVALEDGSKAESSSDQLGECVQGRGHLQGNSWQVLLNHMKMGNQQRSFRSTTILEISNIHLAYCLKSEASAIWILG